MLGILWLDGFESCSNELVPGRSEPGVSIIQVGQLIGRHAKLFILAFSIGVDES